MPSDTAQNPKVYTVPEKNQGRKGSTFTDLLSRNKRGSTVQEVPRSASSFRKPSIIMEEVWKIFGLSVAVRFSVITYLLEFHVFCFTVRWADWSGQASHPADRERGRQHHERWRSLAGPSTDVTRKTPHHRGIRHRQTWPQVTEAPFKNQSHLSIFFCIFYKNCFLSVVCAEMRFTVRSASSFRTTAIVTATSVAGSCCPSVWAFSLPVSVL